MKEHITNNTSPPSLFYNRFPVPFLEDDHSFVKNYNDLIRSFSKKYNQPHNFYIESRVKTIESEQLNQLNVTSR